MKLIQITFLFLICLIIAILKTVWSIVKFDFITEDEWKNCFIYYNGYNVYPTVFHWYFKLYH